MFYKMVNGLNKKNFETLFLKIKLFYSSQQLNYSTDLMSNLYYKVIKYGDADDILWIKERDEDFERNFFLGYLQNLTEGNIFNLTPLFEKEDQILALWQAYFPYTANEKEVRMLIEHAPEVIRILQDSLLGNLTKDALRVFVAYLKTNGFLGAYQYSLLSSRVPREIEKIYGYLPDSSLKEILKGELERSTPYWKFLKFAKKLISEEQWRKLSLSEHETQLDFFIYESSLEIFKKYWKNIIFSNISSATRYVARRRLAIFDDLH